MPIAAMILAGSTASGQTAVKTVIISGSVVDDLGAPIAGAKVHYSNSPRFRRDSSGHSHRLDAWVRSTVLTAKDGSFTIAGVPPSSYWLCAAGVSATHLRSCEWGQSSTNADASNVSSVSNMKLQIRNGAFLTIEVNDTGSRVQDGPGSFRIFAVSGTHYMPATLLSASGSIRQYGLAVPKTATLSLFLDTSLKVVDQSGTAVPAHKPASPIAVNGQTAVTARLTVQ